MEDIYHPRRVYWDPRLGNVRDSRRLMERTPQSDVPSENGAQSAGREEHTGNVVRPYHEFALFRHERHNPIDEYIAHILGRLGRRHSDSSTESESARRSRRTRLDSDESDAEFEDPALFETTSRNVVDHDEHLSNSWEPASDPVFEDYPAEITSDNADGSAHLDNSQELVYDPDFEDPRLFRFLSDDADEVNVVEVDSRVNENTVGKHLWPCVVCVDKPPDTLLSPCSHAACCRDCAEQIRSTSGCPVCSSVVERVDRIYFTQDTCVVCMDNPPETVFKPCYHAVCCSECTSTLIGEEDDDVECKCPICKAYIDEADMFLLAYS